jgi:hypothetical protein
MEATIRKTPCSSPLPELEVPMINTMVACLRVEHRKLNGLNMQLAYGATRLASDAGAIEANQKVLRVWDEIRKIYGRTCKSKTGWSLGARRIMRFRAHCSPRSRTNVRKCAS